MKKKVLIPLVAGGALAAFFSFKYISADDDSPATAQRKSLVVTTVMKAIKEGHFAPRPVDDSFSYAVYHKLLDNLDYGKRFFTQQDINRLNADEFKLDDELKEGDVSFFDRLNTVFVASIDRADAMQKEVLKTPFTFTTNDSVQLSGDKLQWAADESALKARWRDYLKYMTLSKYVELKKEREKKHENKDSAKVVLRTDAELEAQARESVRKGQETLFKRWRKFDDNERFSVFVNAISSSEDPHTDYFAPKMKQAFDEQMSGSFVGIGASLKDEEGKIKVGSIIPGSACWRQGELKAGDEIQKVAQGSDEPLDIQGFEIEDVVQKIRGKKGTEVRLTVKKLDGSIKVIPIIRDVVLMEETFAKSAIFKSPAGPVGYIFLPEFYADFNHVNGRR
jgi:carboxyl-terminal processing protease